MEWETKSRHEVMLCAFLMLFVGAQVQHGEAANILGIFTSYSPSHLIIHMSVAQTLAERGHNVTVVTVAKPLISHPNINVLHLPPSAERQRQKEETIAVISKKDSNIFTILTQFVGSRSPMITMQADIFYDERFKTFLENEDNKFDLLILGYFMNDFQLGIAAKLKIPVIVTWLGNAADMVNRMIGNPYGRSYVPNMLLSAKVTEGRMNFLDRIQNHAISGFMDLIMWLLDRKNDQFYKELFGDEPNFPSLDDMRHNVSLVFCNGHFSEGFVRPNVPALVEIGGIQIKEKPNPLPKDMAELMDSSKEHGVILFSLGSNVDGKALDSQQFKLIFEVLSKLKQKVIWKWDDLANTPGTAPNILYKKWVPQDDILAHPNLRLFITHAGKGGFAEATYHAVPMLALPLFGDQPANAALIKSSGFGLWLDFYRLDRKLFESTVKELIENPKYKNRVKSFSQIYRDRPLTARESVVYWTEYVLRYHGAKHIQSPLVHLNIFQSNGLDVLAVVIVGLIALFYVMKLLWKSLKYMLCKRRAKRTSQADVTGNKKNKKKEH